MLVTAGPKGCKVYRNGALVTLPLGVPVPEMLRLNPSQIQARIDQGIILVDYRAGDALVEARKANKPKGAPPPVDSLASAGEGKGAQGIAPSELPSPAEWVVAETARGFTAHVRQDAKRFLCGRVIDKKKLVEMDADDIAKCAKCSARSE